MWANGVSSAQSLTKLALAQALPSRPLVFLAVAISERIASLYSPSTGRGQTGSPAARPAATRGVAQFGFGGEEAGAAVAEGHDDGAGQGRELDDGRGFVGPARVGDGVDENDAPFRVGVEDLDGFAVEGGDDVAGAGRRRVPGMFSAEGISATRFSGSFSAAAASMMPSTASPPILSHFISSICALGLIEMPPVSKVTALPMSARGAFFAPAPRYSSAISRGGWAEPWPTARMPPKPSRLSWRSSQTFTVRSRPSSRAFAARIAGVNMLPGRLPRPRMVLTTATIFSVSCAAVLAWAASRSLTRT